MSNAADGYLGDWLPHRKSCRCTDCQLETAQKRIAELEMGMESIQRMSAPGRRTLDDFMRDMGYINDRARAASRSPRQEGVQV